MNEKRMDLALCLSTANLILLTVWAEVLFTKKKDYFYMLGAPAWQDYLAPVLLLLLLGLSCYGALRLIRRSGNRVLMLVAELAFLGVLLIPLNAIRFHLRVETGYDFLFLRIRQHHLEIPILVLAAGLFTLVVMRWKRFIRVVAAIVLIFFPFAIMTSAQSLFHAVLALGDQPIPSRIVSAASAPKGPRVVWMIFDEMDESMVFSHRPQGLALPSIDAFRNTSICVKGAVPPSYLTQRSIPALLTGIPIAGDRADGPFELQVTPEGAAHPVPLTTLPSVFDRVRSRGLQTSVAGWSLPYCRLFAKSLDRCSFQPVYQTFTGQVPADEKSLSRAMIDQLAAISPFNRRRLAIHAYREILKDAREAVAAPSGLVFLHFPVPHEPCIYDRRTGEFTTTAKSHIFGYVDNLVLADRTFGELRALMESAGDWDRSTVILSADHGWRDSAQYDGRPIGHVPFLVKLPAQKEAIALSLQFHTIHTQEMALKILDGELADAPAAARWMQEHAN